MCLTSGQVIDVFVLLFFIVFWGCPKHLVYLRLGDDCVCVCDLWPGDRGWLPALHLRGRPPISNRRTPPPPEHCQGKLK